MIDVNFVLAHDVQRMDSCIYHGRTPVIWSISVTSRGCNFFLIMRSFKTYCFSNLEICNTVLLPAPAMLCVASPD